MQIDSPLDQQERYIAYGSGVYFVIVIWLIYFQWSEGSLQSLTGLFTPLLGDVPDYLTIVSLTAIGFAIGYFIKYLGIHTKVDKLFFKFEEEVDNYIISSLGVIFDAPSEGAPGRYQQPRRFELLNIFFEFIDVQKDSWLVQRALFYSYFTKYGLSMNLFSLSVFGIVYILGIISFTKFIGIYGSIALVFLFTIGILAVLVSQKKIRPELLEFTKAQIYRIICDERSRLEKMLSDRFHKNFYNDYYRYQDEEYRQSYYSEEYQKEDRYKNLRLANKSNYSWLIRGLLILDGIIIILVSINTYYVMIEAEKNQCLTSTLIDWCVGSDKDDNMIGTSSPDFMNGTTGNDLMNGQARNDTRYGHDGSDELTAGEGDDFMYGNSDNDNLVGDNGNDHMYGGSGLDEIDGGQGNDVIFQNDKPNEPDGQADIINCGSGKDISFIFSRDGDIVADDCETKKNE